MSDIDQRINEWQAAGVIDASTADRLRAFERDATAAPPAASAAPGPAPAPAAAVKDDARPTVIEALVYLGLVVISAGFIFLIAENWDELATWARILVCVVPTVATLVLGFAFGRVEDAGLRRGAQLAWLVSVALFALSLLVSLAEISDGSRQGDVSDELVLISLLTLGYATMLWAIRPAEPQVAAVAGAVFFVIQALAAWPDDYSTELAGLAGLGAGALALALGERGIFVPRLTVRILFAALVVVTTYIAAFDSPAAFESLCFIASIALLALGIARNSFSLVVAGIGGTFLALVTFVFAHFSDSLGAPVALIISGALVLLGVMLVVQARSITRTRSLMRNGLV